MNSTKNFLILLIICSSFSQLNGQRFDFGATVGVVNSQFDGDRLFGFNKWGTLVGLNWNYNISDLYQIQFDIDYMNIGSEYQGERRPPKVNINDYTLLSINMHSVSLYSGINFKFKEYDKSKYRLRGGAGMRVSRAFVFNANSHNVGVTPVEFNNNILNTTYIGPEGRIGIYILDNLSLNFIIFGSLTNMIVTPQGNIELLRPFYYGFTTSYILPSKKKKKRRRR